MSAIKVIDDADEGMMVWMAEFRMPENKAKTTAYLEKEKVKIQKVSDDMYYSMELAQKLINSLNQKKMKYYFFLPFFIILTLFSCKPTTLPYLGNTVIENGKPKYHVIRDFTYINQDSVQVSNKDLSAYIYIADFFFTSCPSICPKVMKEMLKIHEAFKGDDRVRLVSFTIDPKRDNAEKLKLYSSNLGVDTKYWHF
ncbi:MAG: SCO family protein [Saprospiraceae bacterium]|nr:SCO family protein [Saprospiraceae bacterium]